MRALSVQYNGPRARDGMVAAPLLWPRRHEFWPGDEKAVTFDELDAGQIFVQHWPFTALNIPLNLPMMVMCGGNEPPRGQT